MTHRRLKCRVAAGLPARSRGWLLLRLLFFVFRWPLARALRGLTLLGLRMPPLVLRRVWASLA